MKSTPVVQCTSVVIEYQHKIIVKTQKQKQAINKRPKGDFAKIPPLRNSTMSMLTICLVKNVHTDTGNVYSLLCKVFMRLFSFVSRELLSA